MNTSKHILLLIILIGISSTTTAWKDISRGNNPGELYFSSTWYYLNLQNQYDIICYSDDYGQSLIIKYVCDIYNGDMGTGSILTDGTKGVFYNFIQYPPELYISTDYCCTWSPCSGLTAPSPFYTSGNEEGIIYLRSYGLEGLFKSQDYGENFQQVNDTAYGFIEVGTEPGEIYYHYGPSQFNEFQLYLSIDGGENFDFIQEFDSVVAGINLSGHYPRVFRGSQAGELYFVSWHLPDHFNIYYSTDYGHSFDLRYESPVCDFYDESFAFTPGIEQGTLYYIKGMPWFDGTNTKVHIYYSVDTAKTFSEHIHILDSSFPVNIYTDDVFEQKKVDMQVYPNPFYASTNAEIEVSEGGKYRIELYNLSGQAVLREEQHLEIGEQRIRLSTETLDPGVYVCSVKSGDRILATQKIIKAR